MSVKYQDMRAGDRIEICDAVVELLEKTGRRARVRIDTDAPITFPPAHEWLISNEVSTHGSDHRRVE